MPKWHTAKALYSRAPAAALGSAGSAPGNRLIPCRNRSQDLSKLQDITLETYGVSKAWSDALDPLRIELRSGGWSFLTPTQVREGTDRFFETVSIGNSVEGESYIY